jgi:hypothetical protein
LRQWDIEAADAEFERGLRAAGVHSRARAESFGSGAGTVWDWETRVLEEGRKEVLSDTGRDLRQDILSVGTFVFVRGKRKGVRGRYWCLAKRMGLPEWE